MSSSVDTSPKAKVSYDQDKFMVEFNVQDYAPEDLNIKTEGDVLIVLAKQESKTKGGKSLVSKQFEQRFSLPSGVNPEKISSKLSKDGILTVTAPREAVSISAFKKNEAIENKTKHNGGQVIKTKQSTEGLPEPQMKYEKDKIEISIDVKEYNPRDLDVKVEGNSIVITAKEEIQEPGGTRTRVLEQKFSLPAEVKAEFVKSSLTREGMLVITAPRGNASPRQVTTETLENKMDKVLDPNSWENERKRETVFDDRRRVSAFDDIRRDSERDERRIESAFDDLRRDSAFNSKQRSIFDNSTSFFNDSTMFDDRSLFAANSEQNGISRVQYDDDTYKILVNVENYKPEELVIKTVDNTVIVEAKHEEKTSDGHSYATQSFNQSFTLPRGVDPEAVSSGLSKQGVLTISAPLPKSLKSGDSGMIIPIKHM